MVGAYAFKNRWIKALITISHLPSTLFVAASTQTDRPVSQLEHTGQVSGFARPPMEQLTENNQLFSEMCTPECGLLIPFSLRSKLSKFRHFETQVD